MFPATFDAAAEEVVCVDEGHVQLSDLVRRSLVLYDETTKRDLGNLGIAYENLGEVHRGIQFYEQALVIHREQGDRRGEFSNLCNLGIAYATLGETRRAIEFHAQALLIGRELGDHRAEGNALWNMSLALDQLGERTQAILHAEQALIIREQIADPNAAKVRTQLAAWRKQINR